MSSAAQRALLLADCNRPEQAIPALQEAIRQEPENPVLHARLALCLAHVERRQEAMTAARASLALDANEPLAFLALVQIYQNERRMEQALEAAGRLVVLDPATAYYRGVKSFCHMHRGQWREALASADEGLHLDPQEELCRSARTRALAFLGDNSAALQEGTFLLRENAESPLSHETQGWNHLHAGQPAQAREHFSEALRMSPTNASARGGLAEAFMAEHVAYRWLMPLAWWMQRLSNGRFWLLLLLAYILAGVARRMAVHWPMLRTPVLVFHVVYAGGVLVMLLYPALLRLVLHWGRSTRHLLEPGDRPGLKLIGGLLMITALLLPVWSPSPSVWWMLLGLIGAWLTIPLAAHYQPPISEDSPNPPRDA